MDSKRPEDVLSIHERLERLSPDKRLLLQDLLRKSQRSNTSDPPIPRRPPAAATPLSYAQQRLWTLDQLKPNNPVYNESFTQRFRFRVDVAALERTLNEIVRRHESLRTTFRAENETPIQVIESGLRLVMPVVDVQDFPASKRNEESLRLARQQALIPFNLARVPLFRTCLYQLGREDFILLVVIHHIVCDAWSLILLVTELTTLYSLFSTNRPSSLPELPIQYPDYAIWQRTHLEPERFQRQFSYWEKQLAGLPLLDLPTDKHRPRIPSFQGGEISFQIPQDCFASLKQLSQLEAVTMFMTALTGFAALLHRYTGQPEIAVGVPTANRTRPELATLIGFFINTLVMRCDCSGDPSFRELLRRVRQTALDAQANQDIPFEKLVEHLQPTRDSSRNPLFQVTFQYLIEGESSRQIAMGSLENLGTGTAKFDLRIDFVETPGNLQGWLEYSTDVFSEGMANRLVGHLSTILASAASDPELRLSELQLLTGKEERLFVSWNNTRRDYDADACIHGVVESWVRRNPDSLAVRCHGLDLTYGELNRRANQLAHALRRQGISCEMPVAVCLERSLEMITVLLAVLKAGGAYVPLDPAQPRIRLELLLASTRPSQILTREKWLNRFEQVECPCWCVDRDWKTVVHESEENPACAVDPANLAYIICTSGSTGSPRAVAIEHRSVMNLINWHTRTYKVKPTDRATQIASPAFDASVWEIWPYLCSGASIHIPNDMTIGEPGELVRWLADNGITLSFLPTPLAEAVLEVEFPLELRLRALLTGGDKLRRAPARRLPFALMNHYGPTENTVVTTCTEVHSERDADAAPPIGRPIENVRVYVLDTQGKQVPIGVPGELHIAGHGLARSYFNSPELTAEKFVISRSRTADGTRLYKTGDLVRYRPDGALEFLGRLDHQVKIRGFRIELGEIESALRRHPAIRECVVEAREETSGEKRLAAYVVPKVDEDSFGQPWRTASEEVQIGQWRQIYDETYQRPAATQNPHLNLVGWNSSYTGQAIPEPEMQEQVDHTVARIRCLHPARVLEIGCGTGLLLFPLAPQCERYVATDFSPPALEYVRKQLPAVQGSNVILFERRADDFSGFEDGSFDVVVLNSIVQYFPSAKYLARVLKSAVRALAPGGYVFIGDVRNLKLLEELHTGVRLHRAGSATPLIELREQVRRAQRQEQELLIAPAFFDDFARSVADTTCVNVELKRGKYHNELTRFRYDVTLQVGGPPAVDPACAVLNWEELGSLPALRRRLREPEERGLRVLGVPNARLVSERAAVQRIRYATETDNVGYLRRALQNLEPGVDPEQIWSLEPDTPFRVHITWPAAGPQEFFDVVFDRKDNPVPLKWSGSTVTRSLEAHSNFPIHAELMERLAPALRTHLQDCLPEYMIPSTFMVLSTIPLATNGKVDRKALPAPNQPQRLIQTSFLSPRTELEKRLAAIWQDVLGLQRVGIHDNFFDLGGHSLLLIRVHNRLRENLKVDYSAVDLFRFPTISSLAQAIRTEREANGESRK